MRDIARQTGFDRRTVAKKWIRADALPERSAGAPTTSRGISKIIYLAAGQRVASAADDCSRKSKRAVTRAVFQSRTAAGEMAQTEMQDTKPHRLFRKSRDRPSRDWTLDLADCGCGALHQAAWIVDRQSSCKSPFDEKATGQSLRQGRRYGGFPADGQAGSQSGVALSAPGDRSEWHAREDHDRQERRQPAAIESYNEEHEADIEIRRRKYLKHR